VISPKGSTSFSILLTIIIISLKQRFLIGIQQIFYAILEYTHSVRKTFQLWKNEREDWDRIPAGNLRISKGEEK